MSEQITSLDLSKLSPLCRYRALKAVRETLEKEAAAISRAVAHYPDDCGEPKAQMEAWRDAARDVVRHLSKLELGKS